jgi:hypothetical protein
MQHIAVVDIPELGVDWPVETERGWLPKALLDSAYLMEKTD